MSCVEMGGDVWGGGGVVSCRLRVWGGLCSCRGEEGEIEEERVND